MSVVGRVREKEGSGEEEGMEREGGGPGKGRKREEGSERGKGK